MILKRRFLTENNCYKSGKKHTVKGIMVHSTGANNPNLKRYVQPDDGLLGKNTYNNAWNQPTPGGRQVCVHGFIGKLADGSIATYQTLPWDMVGWHSGGGSKGNANYMGYVGFEICEDGLVDAVYFERVYTEAVELCAHLCKQYNLNPKTDIICHSEGHSMGIASNHGDVMHWFPKFGKDMNTFRTAVAEKLGGAAVSPAVPQTPSQKPSTLAVGDVVTFMGKSNYSNANSAVAVPCRPGKAKITSIFPKGKHPYHLIRVSGGTSNVYGWVDANDIWELCGNTAVIAVGATVMITGTKYATGQTIPAWVKKKTHVVSRINGTKALLGANGGICSWVYLTDIKAV